MIFFRKSKKAQIEVQFNWIFVLIVGAFILIFFIAIVNVQKQNADKTLAFDILGKIDLIISGALTIPKTGQIFDMPKIEFRFQCDRISALGVDRQFQDRVVFGPDLLSGRQLIVWSQDWNVPYKTTNFLYVTADTARYIIFYDTSEPSAQQLFQGLPDNMTKETVNSTNFSQLADKNNYKIRVVFFDDVDYDYITNKNNLGLKMPAFMVKMPDSAVTAVQLNESTNEVRFFVKNGNNFTALGNPTEIIGDPMKYGAVFSESKDEFNCSYHKAFKKLVYVSKIYSARESEIESNYSGNADCSYSQARAGDLIDNIATAAETADIGTITINMGYVNARNNDALKKSCAPIY